MKHWLYLLASTLTSPLAFAQQSNNCDISNDITPIAAIQGSSLQSPMVGTVVTTMGVVTHNQAAPEQLGGIFIQSPQNLRDDNKLTSEGLFVQASGATFNAFSSGTLIKLSGQITETNNLTQLRQVSAIFECGQQAVDPPVTVTLPFASATDAESNEAMLVTLQGVEPLTISGHYPLARYGYFDVSSGRLYTPTQVAMPGSEAAAVAQANELNRVQVDDNRQQPPQHLPHQQLFHGPQHSLRSGATVKPIIGVLSQFENAYRLQPTQPAELASRSRITAIQPTREDELRIASFNVLNYFNGDGKGGGFPTERGAENIEQLARQQTKIVSAIDALNADIIGLMEVENDGFEADSAIRQLVTAINQVSEIDYAIAQPQSTRVGDDQISVAIIYNPERLRPQAHAETLQQGPFRRGSRVPLAQVFIERNSGHAVTAVVNHFKSKGSCPDTGVNANQGDGQACWNAMRLESAQLLSKWLKQQQFPAPVLLGDFNAYYYEDPIRYLDNSGFSNVSEASDYSYVYDSQAGALDHIFVAQSLRPAVRRVQHINFNADEPVVYDYRDTQYYQPGPYRASDHDPLLVDLVLSADD